MNQSDISSWRRIINLSGLICDFSINLLIDECERAAESSELGDVVIVISSSGGQIKSALYGYKKLRGIANKLRKNGRKLITVNIGEVGSSAIFIFCAGDYRIAFYNSFFCIHKTTINDDLISTISQLTNSCSDMEEVNRSMDKIVRNSVNWWHRSKVAKMLHSEGILTSSEAKEVGLVTELYNCRIKYKNIKGQGFIVIPNVIKYSTFTDNSRDFDGYLTVKYESLTFLDTTAILEISLSIDSAKRLELGSLNLLIKSSNDELIAKEKVDFNNYVLEREQVLKWRIKFSRIQQELDISNINTISFEVEDADYYIFN